jgi:D-aminopeptidase
MVLQTPVGSLPFQQLANRARDLGTGARLEADFCHATDMEGVGGVNNADEQLLPGQRRYEESRRLLTGEVNAAVVGALEAGASQVVIWDGHDASRSLSIDEIHPRAQLIQGRDTPADYYLAEKLYDGIMFVGQHAMAQAKGRRAGALAKLQRAEHFPERQTGG